LFFHAGIFMFTLSELKRAWLRAATALFLIATLAACGGDGQAQPADEPLDDKTVYSTLPEASLPSASEAAAVTHGVVTLEGQPIAYTATAGHLTARDRTSGAAQASMFYVAYTADRAKASDRPVTFVYNGGPGSASAWLHLGSFGPVRLAVPATIAGAPAQFPMVANAQSLLDITDLVFVDAVGTGYSQAIAPNTNRSFWGVDSDAAVFRDFVMRYLEVNGRGASPKYLFGESYGATRSAVLALELERAGVRLAGLVLQSAILDFNADCGFLGAEQASCSGYLASYAAAAHHHARLTTSPADPSVFLDEVKRFADLTYEPAVAAFLAEAHTAPEAALYASLSTRTGTQPTLWQSHFNLDPTTFRAELVPGMLIGRYDARISAPFGSALAQEGDPSYAFVAPSFHAAIGSALRDRLRYSAASDYALSNAEILQPGAFDPRHNGGFLPDTVPDLAAALALNPSLRILSMSGRHDLATPFHQAERDLKRLGSAGSVTLRVYDAGHMISLDDAARVLQKADLRTFYANGTFGTQ
jgi:carboxypeptidase C (cathepsin A)